MGILSWIEVIEGTDLHIYFGNTLARFCIIFLNEMLTCEKSLKAPSQTYGYLAKVTDTVTCLCLGDAIFTDKPV